MTYVTAFGFRIVGDEVREGLGATLLEGPIQLPNGPRTAFLWGPDDARLEHVQRGKVAGGC